MAVIGDTFSNDVSVFSLLERWSAKFVGLTLDAFILAMCLFSLC